MFWFSTSLKILLNPSEVGQERTGSKNKVKGRAAKGWRKI